MNYAIPRSKETTRASGTFSISTENSVKVCKAISRKKLPAAKKMLEGLITEKSDLNGKHYTRISKELLGLLNQAEKNARSKNLDSDSLFLFISAHRGPTMHRGRRRWRKFGSRMKITHVQAVLSANNKFDRIVPSKIAKKAAAEAKAEKKE